MNLFKLVGVTTLLHRIRETLPYSMSSWHHNLILYPHLIMVAQWQRWSHCSRLLGYDCCILPFVDVEVNKGTETCQWYRGREWKTIGIIMELLCMIPHWLHSMCSLLCGYWYVWVIFSCTSIYVQKHQFQNTPQCLHKFISQTYIYSRNIV